MNYDPELAALLSQPWSEGACRGYVISAMERCGFKPADIQQVMMELHEIFDYTTLEEARACETCGSMVPIDDPINFIADMADIGIIMDDAFNRCEKCSEEHFAWEEYCESLTSEL